MSNNMDVEFDDVVAEDAEAAGLFWPPFLLQASGTYRTPPLVFTPGAAPNGIVPPWVMRDELRLDVDGRYPQMTASGRVVGFGVVEWVASLSPSTKKDTWIGDIWFKDGATSLLPQSAVEITVTRSFFPAQRKATVVFHGLLQNRTTVLNWASATFGTVEFEYDHTSDSRPTTTYHTATHPNRPAGLPLEELSIEKVFTRTGFTVTKSGGDGVLPAALADSNGLANWSDLEMHDAMQVYWSRFANKAQWALWVFWARQHEMGHGLGGIMFDDIGPNHRQGTAIFTDSFISEPPPGDPAPAAWVRRSQFWTAVHEMGHAFNLAHSWQKHLGTPWIPLASDPEARSFMNYPDNVMGGQAAFYGDFEFRFSDQELLFMRHAPRRFVRMGDAAWFDHHGFEDHRDRAHPALQLSVRANRPTARFEYLEPVVLELKLANTSAAPVLVDRNILEPGHGMTVVIKRHGMPARQWLPYQRRCVAAEPVVLAPGEALYGSLPVFAGTNGWDLAEPGHYDVHVALDSDTYAVVSPGLRLAVDRPRDGELERLGAEVLTDEVGRTLAFGGTRFFTDANDVLRSVVERAGGSRLARHAAVALAQPAAIEYKALVVPGGPSSAVPAADAAGAIVSTPSSIESVQELAVALRPDDDAAETFGHIGLAQHVRRVSARLAEAGEAADAAACQSALRETFEERGVLPSVVADIARDESRYAQLAGRSARSRSATNGNRGRH